MKISELRKILDKVEEKNGNIEVCYMCDPYHSNDFYTPIINSEIVENPSPHIEGKRIGRDEWKKPRNERKLDFQKEGKILNLI